MNRNRRVYDKWQIDKRIPVVLVITLLMEAGGMVYGAAKLDSRVAVVEKYQEQQRDFPERLARIEQKLDDMRRQ